MNEQEIAHIKSLAEKDPAIKKLWEFYSGITMDGVKAIKITLNAKLISLNAELSKPDCNYDVALDEISLIAKTLKKLPKEEKTEDKQEKVKSSGKKKSVFDSEADKDR